MSSRRRATAARNGGQRTSSRIPDALRDDEIRDLRATAMRVRAAFGPKDSVRDVLPAELTEPLLDAIDRLLRTLARREATTGI